MIFYADVENHKLKIQNKSVLQDYLEQQKDGLYSIELKRSKSPKTIPQLGYYFGYICKKLGNHLGYTMEEMHEALKYEHLKRIDEHGLVIVGSVKKLSTEEMSNFTTRVRIWALERFRVVLLPPDKNWKIVDINL